MGGITLSKAIDCYDWVIYLGSEWGQFFKRHLIKELARQLPNSRILCVARPMCLLTGPLCRPREFLAWLKHLSIITILDKNLLYVRPGVLLNDHLDRYIPLVRRINRHWLRRQLHTAIKREGLRSANLIALIYDPFQLEYLGLVKESISIYDIYDEYAANPGRSFLRTQDELAKREQSILKKVDAVLVVSEKIEWRIKGFHSRVSIVPNAADVEHFALAADPKLAIPSDAANIPHPIAGYLGNITSRIDFGLIRHLATLHPEWSVVLVGGVSEPNLSIPKSLSDLPNVHCLGKRPYKTLPGFLKAFDVCIIPYVAGDPFNIGCSPLKLYEYLATGKPIVSTDLPAVRLFDDIVRIARDAGDFERQIGAALKERDKGLVRRRLTAARENSWERRAEILLEAVEGVLREKQF